MTAIVEGDAVAPQPIHEVLAAVMGKVRAVGKTDFHNSPTAKFKFRGVDAVVNAVAPILREHKVIVYPLFSEARYRDVRTSQDKPAREVTVSVHYRFLGPAGDHIDVVVPGESMDHGDKGTAKAMSVAFRIALIQALCLPTDEPDPDHDAYERADKSEEDELRENIRAEARKRGIDLYKVAADFHGRTKVAIADAKADLLRHYLGHLRTHGLVAARGESDG